MILMKLRILSPQLTHWIPEDWFQGNAIPEMKYKAAAELWLGAVQMPPNTKSLYAAELEAYQDSNSGRPCNSGDGPLHHV